MHLHGQLRSFNFDRLQECRIDNSQRLRLLILSLTTMLETPIRFASTKHKINSDVP
jgi:hypothetical protein